MCQATTEYGAVTPPGSTDVYFQRFLISLEELNNRCRLVFDHRSKRIDSERRKRARLRKPGAQTSPSKPQPRKRRRPAVPCLPEPSDRHITLLRKCLAIVCEFKPGSCGGESRIALDWDWPSDFKHLERAILNILFAYGQWSILLERVNRLYLHQRLCSWPLTWYNEIELLWNHSQYKLFQRKEFAKMTPVDTFRIRKRNPSPTENLVGRSKYSISEKAIDLLKSAYQIDRKPGKGTKLQLARETGLTMETINNWFKNRRQRDARLKSSQGADSIFSYSPPISQEALTEGPADPLWAGPSALEYASYTPYSHPIPSYPHYQHACPYEAYYDDRI